MKSILIISLILFSSTVEAINPSRVYERTPKDYGLTYYQHQINTPDSYKINVWEYGPNNAAVKKTIIFVGTDAGNMSHLIWQAKHFSEKGFRVISFDYRGFGKSSDFEINRNYLYHPEFAVDLDSVIAFVKEKYPDDEIGLYALSMGTYISLLKEQDIDYIVAEGFYSDPIEVVKRIKKNKNKVVLLPEGASVISNSNREVPVLIFTASQDQVTTPEDAERFAKSNSNVEVVDFIGIHLGGFHAMTDENPGDIYIEAIIEFLN